MGAIAQIKDGKVVESNSAASLAKDTKKNGSTMDKEAFLNLLVAQMKYRILWSNFQYGIRVTVCAVLRS